ncbi:MAG: hypothetical protein LBV72_08100 [Tannerella sp.]|jgi:ligand-binding sensor domain-containing protein|nr:hypothetical protein [Tannerella sp.]
MRNNFFLLAFIPVCWFLLFDSINIQAAENSILFNRLDVNNGLSSNEVSCVYKGRKGFMWFGTGAGLTRYDGYEFKTFRHEVDGALFSEGYIMELVETMDGKLWVTYQSGEISIFDIYSHAFYTVSEIQQQLGIQSTIVNVFQDNDYQLLFAASDNHLYKYNYTSRRLISYPVYPEEGGVCDLVCNEKGMYIIYYSGVLEIINPDSFEQVLKDDFLKKLPAPKRFNLFVDK